MKGFKKFWFVLYLLITGLFFLALVVLGAAQITEIIKIPRIEPLDYYFTLPSLGIAGAVFLILAVYGLSLIGSLKNKKGIPVVRRLTPDGDINISVDAIKTITETAITEFTNVQIDQTGVLIKDNTVDIFVKVFITDSNKLADTTTTMQNRIKEVIEDNMGIVVNSVRILVNDIKNNNKPLAPSTVKTKENTSQAPIDPVSIDNSTGEL